MTIIERTGSFIGLVPDPLLLFINLALIAWIVKVVLRRVIIVNETTREGYNAPWLVIFTILAAIIHIPTEIAFQSGSTMDYGLWPGTESIGAIRAQYVPAAVCFGSMLYRFGLSKALPDPLGKEIGKAPMTAAFGMLMITLYIIAAVFAPLIAPFSETEVVAAQFEVWEAPYYLGTDNLGRDMLSRLIYAARNTVGIALLTAAIAFAVGMTAGLLAAVLGGWVDQMFSRIVDVLMAIPSLVFALLLLTIFGTSILSLVLVIALLDSTRVYRLTRAVSMNVVVMDYVEAAKLRGENIGWLMRKEILPNITAPLVAEFGLRFCFVFLTISALSFLGLGIQPPTADWGSMVRDNATLITFGDITPLLPAAAIALLTVAVNFVVDWMLHRSSGLKE